MASPRFPLARAHRSVRRSTGTNMTLNSASLVELAAATNGPGTGGFDMTIEAQIGDVLRVQPALLLGPEAFRTWLNVATMVGGSPVNYVAGGSGVSAGPWYARDGVYYPLGPALHYTVVSGDLASGAVTLRPMYQQSSAGNRVLYTDSTSLLEWSVQNLGPTDPE